MKISFEFTQVGNVDFQSLKFSDDTDFNDCVIVGLPEEFQNENNKHESDGFVYERIEYVFRDMKTFTGFNYPAVVLEKTGTQIFLVQDSEGEEHDIYLTGNEKCVIVRFENMGDWY